MARLTRLLVVCIVVGVPLLTLVAARAQGTVFAEAINQANLRAGPGTDFEIVGAIQAGTQYPVIGRSARYPWYLLALPDRQGWVYKDLVTITGDINTVPFSDAIIPSATPLPAATAVPVEPTQPATPPGTPLPPAIETPPVPAEPTLTPTLTPTQPATVYAEAIDYANVRYGPGTDFPRIGTIQKGQLYAVLRRHTTFDKWIEIAFAEVAGGRGWVFIDTVRLTGDLRAVQAINITSFGYPTLTPTAQMVVLNAPGAAAAVNLEALGNQIYDYLLAQRFEPGTTRQASVFLLDLSSGQSVSLNPNVAYSGTSVMKIAVLVAFYRKIMGAPTADQARLLAEMIMCSENLSSNRVLAILGDGDEYRGTLYVTETLNLLGIRDSFLIRSFFTGAQTIGPTPTEQPFIPIITQADQKSAEPDPSNQATPADLGTLLAGIYHCALDGGGPLAATFPNDIDVNDCRRMFRLLRANQINALIESGVPAGTTVAHKHGYVDETHGDAAILLTPGGDYVLSIMLYNREHLIADEGFSAIAEVSRLAYNAYNPAQTLAQARAWNIPLCSFDTITALDPQLMTDMQAGSLPPIR